MVFVMRSHRIALVLFLLAVLMVSGCTTTPAPTSTTVPTPPMTPIPTTTEISVQYVNHTFEEYGFYLILPSSWNLYLDDPDTNTVWFSYEDIPIEQLRIVITSIPDYWGPLTYEEVILQMNAVNDNFIEALRNEEYPYAKLLPHLCNDALFSSWCLKDDGEIGACPGNWIYGFMIRWTEEIVPGAGQTHLASGQSHILPVEGVTYYMYFIEDGADVDFHDRMYEYQDMTRTFFLLN